MEPKLKWVMIVMLALINDWYCCSGCWEQERIALLHLKAHINHPNGTSLPDWVEDKNDADCCNWSRVVCNITTRRVTQLDLFYVRVFNNEDWYFNASMLLQFEKLEALDLFYNQMAGWVENEGFERVSSRLRNLKFLDLHYNRLNNNIISSLSGLSSLKFLYLYENRLKGPIQIKELDAFSNLETLYISYNNISEFMVPEDKRCLGKLKYLGLSIIQTNNNSILLQSLESFPSLKTLSLDVEDTMTTLELHNLTNVEELFLYSYFSSFHINFLQSLGAFTSLKNLSLIGSEINGTLTAQDLPNFKNLEYLDMYGNTLNNNNSFLQTIGEMNSLKVLILSYSRLGGTLPAQGLCELIRLQKLDISYNDLGGNLPECLANLTSLQYLDLSGNQFTGAVSPLKSLISIQYLSLSNNHFQIPISLTPFFNYSKLEHFDGANNEIYAETESHSLAPKFQLKSISVSGYGYGGALPKFLYHQHDLQKVDLSHIHFRGAFPNWLLENNTGLHALSLVNNSLSGPFEAPSFPHMNLSSLDVSNNFFYGQIPVDVGAYFPRLGYLNMSTNAFNDSIPSSFGDMNSLQSLDLSNNNLSGGIPEHLVTGCLTLYELILSNNRLQGQIFSANVHVISLERLQLDGNHFTGRIPDKLSNCSYLSVLDISNNNLTGRIPGWMGNMSYLGDITMPNNHLEGPIPTELCQLDLEVLDLSENNISGIIPSCFSPPRINRVHLSKNRLQGPLTDAFYNSSFMVTLDLSNNHLTGSIPNWINRLSGLSYLLLNNNDLKGEIPFQLCQLDQLSLIDLSHNNFFGRIPHCLNITAVKKESAAPNFDPNAVASAPISVSTQERVEFTTKSVSYSYKGKILTYMSGIDLSCNKLTGEIPHEIGNLSKIHVLNLSHNSLSGPIPASFANLGQIESLDLSNNNLSGKIPHELVELYALAVFSVAHNNLSGKIPETAQFATFEKSSYEANPLLCGTPLPKSCTGSPSSMPRASIQNGEDSGFIDMDSFYVTFSVSYIIVLLVIAAVLYINPYWRRAWFYMIEMCITSCYYFVEDNFPKRCCH